MYRADTFLVQVRRFLYTAIPQRPHVPLRGASGAYVSSYRCALVLNRSRCLHMIPASLVCRGPSLTQQLPFALSLRPPGCWLSLQQAIRKRMMLRPVGAWRFVTCSR